MYQLQNTFDTVMVSREANTDFSTSIANVINAIYGNSVSAKRKVKQNLDKPLTESDILETADANNNFKILSDSTYPNGVFVTFKEFLNNSPSIAKFLQW